MSPTPRPIPRRLPHRIETERLTLRCFEPTDAPALCEAMAQNQEHLARWLPWFAGEPEDLDAKLERVLGFRSAFDAGTDFAFGIFEPDGTLVGAAGLHLRVGPRSGEVGYWLAADRTGRGYATEVARALTHVALGWRGDVRVAIRCEPGNAPSRAVPERLGFVEEGLLRAVTVGERDPVDLVQYTLLARELDGKGWPRPALFDALGRELAWDAPASP